MAPDRRLVDEHQVEIARQMVWNSIDYLERQLGLNTLRPPTGKALIRRLAVLKHQLQQLEELLGALADPTHSEDRTAPP